MPAAYGDYPGVAIADGMVWGVPRGEVVQAISLEDGTPRWNSPISKRAAVFTPALTAELVLFGTNEEEPKLTAADRATGTVRWTAPMDLLALAHPLVIGETVVVRNRKPDRLVCLELATGRERWRCDLPVARFMADYAQTLHLDGQLVTCDAEGIKWFDAATGELRRSLDVGGGFLTCLLEDGDSIVAIARIPELYVVPRAGDEAPRKILFPRGHGPLDRRPACRRGLVHGASEDYQTRFSVYLAKGEVTIHESKVHGFGRFTAGTTGEVYAIHGNQLRAFDLETGEPRWQVGTDPRVSEPAFATPVPHEGGIVVVAANAVHSYAWE